MFHVQRNGQFDETGLIARAVSTLRIKLPAAWQVQVADAPGPQDAILTISSGTAGAATFAIEAKNATRVSAADAVNQLDAASQANPRQLMFITEYMNPPLRRECESRGLSYLDTTGWAYVVSDNPPILIRLEGASRPPSPRGNAPTARINGPAAGRTVRRLLELDPPLGIRQLAELSSSSPGAVSKLMPTLVDAGAIERSTEGTIVHIRRRSLLERWTADYSFLNSNSLVLDYLAPRGLPYVLDRLRDRNDLCVTGSAAARTYLPPDITSVLPLSLLTVYGKDIPAIANSLGLVRTSRETSNVLMTVPRDPLLLEQLTQSAAGFRVAPLGQVLADLLTLPGRMAQEAEQLMDLLAHNDPAWRE